MKVLLKTALGSYSGYGVDGVGLAQALIRAGLDVYLDPEQVGPPIPAAVAQLLTKRLDGPFDLTIQHSSPDQLHLSEAARRGTGTAVAWTMWEYETTDNLPSADTLSRRLVNFDLVLGYDTVSTAALVPHTRKVATLQGGFWPEHWPAVQRDWHSERFGFCMVGQLHRRKDPFVAVQAFKELKDEHAEFAPAELHLKTNIPGLHPAMQDWCPGLYVHYAVWPTDQLRAFYARQHVLLAPSRGEGKNVPALEFLSTGGTVIATNWGGPTQWLSSQYAYPLDFELVAESPAIPNCRSARASKDHLKALMLHVFHNRAEAARKGDLAAQLIPSMCGWEPVLDRLFTKLSEHVPNGGHLAHAYRNIRATQTTMAAPAHA